MSVPISPSTAVALIGPMPGIVTISSVAARKEPRCVSTPRSMTVIDWSRSIDLIEMHAQEQAVHLARAAVEGFRQGLGRGLDARMGQRGQTLGVPLAGDDGLQHRAPALAKHVGDHAVELDVGFLQRLLDALDMGGALPHQLLPGAHQAPQLDHLLRRHEAAPDQPVRLQIREPDRVRHVALAARNGLDVLGIGQNQLEVPGLRQDAPHRLPVDPGRLHRHGRDVVARQPLRQGNQAGRRRLEGAYLDPDLAVLNEADGGHHRLLVYVEPGATRMQDLHRFAPCLQSYTADAGPPAQMKSETHAQGLASRHNQGCSRGSRSD